MEKSPNALRKHVVLLGRTNAGKSTLFNALTGQDNAIVSHVPGTTTDPVSKAMELIPYGPIVLVDTPGLEDKSDLGEQRMQKTRVARRRADAALYVADCLRFDPAEYEAFGEQKLDHLLVFTKGAESGGKVLENLCKRYPQAFFWREGNLEELQCRLSQLLSAQSSKEEPLIADLVPPGGTVILVVPIDSAAPKGRLILPQVQVLRECLDSGILAMVCRETELATALKRLDHVDLVVTDSQVFSLVEKLVPNSIYLTSFSMLLARQKGSFRQLLEGVEAISTLPQNANILMLEGCTHNRTHEDIGRVKIPAILEKKTGNRFHFDFYSGYDFPEELSHYHMAIQCGSCMINRREITARLEAMAQAKIPVTNYGVLLAWASGILPRCRQVFGEVSG